MAQAGKTSATKTRTAKKGESRVNIEQQLWGTVDDAPVTRYTLSNEQGVEVAIINYGGIITTLRTPDSNGQIDDIVLGFDTLQEYVDHNPFFGCIAGRYANRIAHGRFELDGNTVQLAQNNGDNHLHGGTKGFDKVVWFAATRLREQAAELTLRYLSPDGDEGYPGALDVTVTYTLSSQNQLAIDYIARTTKPTIVNLTNHTYFNLAGHGSILDHQIQIAADQFTPVTEALIPTGQRAAVAETPFDFRQLTAIGARIEEPHEQLRYGGGYDHNWVLNQSPENRSPQIIIFEPTTERRLDVHTTQPGVQFYTGNMMPTTLAGKAGQTYRPRTGFCLETQHFPDSPNQPTFPNTVLRPGETLQETTIFTFGHGLPV